MAGRLPPYKSTTYAMVNPCGMGYPRPMAKKPRPVSTQRAGVLAILAPGWGDWHAGRPWRATLLFTAFFALLAWMSWVLAELIVGHMTSLFQMQQRQWEYPPLLQLGASGVGMVWIWTVSITTGVMAAMERYHLEGRPQDRVPWFGVIVSWCAPGTGQIYAERRTFGLALLGLYLLSFFLIIPVIQQTVDTALAFTETIDPGLRASPLALVDRVDAFATSLQLEMRLSLAWQFHSVLRAMAIADVCWLLSQPRTATAGDEFLLEPASDRPAWEMAHTAKFAGYFALGLICPGSGQLLQGRHQIGWTLFGIYYGMLALASGILALDLVEAASLNVLLNLGLAIRIVAAGEACWRFEKPIATPQADG